MDTKSLARSKRAHTQQHNKKYHPNPKSKSLTTPLPPNENPIKKRQQVAEKPRKPSLPSNWDRYEDEFDSISESNVSKEGMIMNDVVLPKSKGGDFAYLISEAQSQLDSQDSASSSRFASFEDVLTDFIPGMSSMLSVRGNGMLSWIGNDNFIVDDTSATTSEASSYLSMDLHSLASQLEKLDASQRLFLEPDLLPSHLETSESKLVEECTDEFSFLQLSTESVPMKDDYEKIENLVKDNVSKESKNPTFDELTADLDMLLNSSEPVNTLPILQWGDSTSTSTSSSILSKGVIPSSSTVSLDEFDSWLDTI